MFEEEDGELEQIDLEFIDNHVVYNGRKIEYNHFLEETSLETFFLLIMEYANELTNINQEKSFQNIFDTVFTEAFMEISREYDVPDFVSESFSSILLREKKRKYYKKYMNDVRKNVLQLLTKTSLN